jgi:hypothetical protein
MLCSAAGRAAQPRAAPGFIGRRLIARHPAPLCVSYESPPQPLATRLQNLRGLQSRAWPCERRTNRTLREMLNVHLFHPTLRFVVGTPANYKGNARS